MSVPTITLTDHQRSAADQILAAVENKSHFRLGGYAGTGKTALASVVIPEMRSELKKQVRVVAPTGKAASVLRSKGVFATTIHGLIYEIETEKPLTFRKLDTLPCNVVVCDEASMVAADIFEDLLSYNVPLVFIGDPGQLEPVGKDPKLMHNPDAVLSEVHRQALDNPIIEFATWLRNSPMRPAVFAAGQYLQLPDEKKELLRFQALSSFNPFDYDQIIVGTNKTRVSINTTCRNMQGFTTSYPQKGEKLICLANSRKQGVFNGMQVTTISDYDTIYDEVMVEDAEGRRFLVECDPAAFMCEKFERRFQRGSKAIPFDYSYAITTHKSQGSEWGKVFVMDQAFGDPPNRWRYTAATRAKEQLVWAF